MKVLIAVDGSEYSSAAVDAAIDQCWPSDVEFLVLNAVEPFYYQFALAGGYAEPVVEAQREFEKFCRQFVMAYVERLRKVMGEAKVSGETVEGSPAECIIQRAKDWNADLILIGSQGRTGLPKLLLGSVASRVIAHAPCSVEVVRPRKPRHPETADAKYKIVSK